ncbi:anti-sigma factor antagonist [Blastococcus sp. CT_GayMR19]|uniref:STAS domain-containing protein n=1 Tax=Blastococcus sp. CT_GayMR19 TaxID=2559608 RepID=UPI0010742A47|nr:STAS domain-containing protein [Blastococcus sp. CT_GayMR19]TFV79327.1 anti-sigma factor antagonist [Blastococcus sp. CT_GayMR19]
MSTSGPLSQHDSVPLTEVVDMRQGSVRVSGHLTVQGADLLRGTVETMRRDGHSTVLLDLQDLQAADSAGLQVLRNLRQSVAADGGELFVSPSPRGLTPRL